MIKSFIHYWRTTFLLTGFLLTLGIFAYFSMPKEVYPEISIPNAYVNIWLNGITPEDAEKTLVQPVEDEIKNLKGVKTYNSWAYEGGAEIHLEFESGLDVDECIRKVKDNLSNLDKELPDKASGAHIHNYSTSEQPVLVVVLSGDIPETTLFKTAETLRDLIAANITEATRVGSSGIRSQEIEISVDPSIIESYRLPITRSKGKITSNNQTISIGKVNSNIGRTILKLPGLIKNLDQLLETPIMSSNNKVVKLKDITKVKRKYKPISTIARFNGDRVVFLNIIKRTGANVLNTVTKVKKLVEKFQETIPNKIKINYSQDISKHIRSQLKGLQNNLLTTIFIVMLIVFLGVGLYSSVLVGIAIPSSFLLGILIIKLLGYTINFMVLFALMIAVGMLVDGAIIVVEDADRQMVYGVKPKEAFITAGARMFVPVLTSIATTIVVFIPMLFWPGIMGQFMRPIPLTLIATLSSSLVVATILMPVVGSFISKRQNNHKTRAIQDNINAIDKGEFSNIQGITKYYINILKVALNNPGKVILGSFILLLVIIISFIKFGNGFIYMNRADPNSISISVISKDSLSIYQKDSIVNEVCESIKSLKGIESITSRAFDDNGKTIGSVIIELEKWDKRPLAYKDIISNIDEKTKHIHGVILRKDFTSRGPSSDPKISFNVKGDSVVKPVKYITKKLREDPELSDIKNNLTSSLSELVYKVDKTQAARFGLDTLTIGNTIKLATTGLKLDTYTPADSNDELEIYLRLSDKYQTISHINDIRIFTPGGFVPLSSLVTKTYQRSSNEITRKEGKRYIQIQANVVNDINPSKKEQEIVEMLKKDSEIAKNITIEASGSAQDQKEANNFYKKSFLAAIVLISIILITQFNSVFYMLLILTSVLMSTTGLFFGLLVTNQPFSVILCGIIGAVSLAGIIVGNNILMIDTYLHYKARFSDLKQLLLITGAQRLRAILLTQLTTTLGLIPIIFYLDINLLEFSITYGSPSSQFWRPLATSLVFGILFATPMTLFFTPCALLLKEKAAIFIKEYYKSKQ